MLVSKKSKDINLIPESESSLGLKKAILPLVLFGLLIFLTLSVSLVLFLINSGEKTKAGDLEKSIEVKNSQWQLVASAAARVSQVKNKISQYQALVSKYPPLENYVQKLAKSLPSGISIVTLDIDNSGKATIQVKAPSASEAYQFLNTIAEEKASFSSVKLGGLSRATDKEEYTVSLTMIINK